jgi:hypothetical protein
MYSKRILKNHQIRPALSINQPFEELLSENTFLNKAPPLPKYYFFQD